MKWFRLIKEEEIFWSFIKLEDNKKYCFYIKYCFFGCVCKCVVLIIIGYYVFIDFN